jgi:hypothetical protein
MSEITSQQRQIESIHRGFLYQHLFASACLLTADARAIDFVVVEADEDIEVCRGTSRFYLQIKTRSEPLIPSDVAEYLVRFSRLRAEHASGQRDGTPFFCFISNQPPGPKLSEQLEGEDWPDDVEVIWPGKSRPQYLDFLPPAWLGLPDAITCCIEYAEQVPHRKISAETLVLKISSLAMLAASGGKPYEDHRFEREELPALFEQVAMSLQKFPPPPPDYRLQLDEPNLRSSHRLRMIVGFSGAGKTAWASHAAIHSDGLFVYYDVGDELGPSMPSALASEITATFSILDPNKPLNEIVVPSSSGLNLLRQLAAYASTQSLDVTIVIDNSHRVPASVMRSVFESTAPLKLVILAHPGEMIEELESILEIHQERLHGWSEDTIAAAVSETGAKGSPADLMHLREMTSGMPLYVMSAARASVAEYHGDLGSFCSAVDAQRHTKRTPQEIILSKIYEMLPQATQEAVAVISFSDVPFTQSEIEFILGKALGLQPAEVGSLIRALRPQGILLAVSGDDYSIHDAFRLIGKQKFDLMASDKRTAALRALVAILTRSLQNERDKKRLTTMIRALSAIGDYSVLIGLAGEEMFHELGIGEEVWKILETAVEGGKLPPKQHFDALDGLVFRYLKTGQIEKVAPRLSEMEALIESAGLSMEDRLSFLSKNMQFHAELKDTESVARLSDLIELLIPDDPVFERIHRYGKAQALWHLGLVPQAERILRGLVPDYMAALGIRPDQVYGFNSPEIRKLLRDGPEDHAAVKHLADTFAFHAQTLERLGKMSTVERLQAMKFYTLVGAYDSLVQVGMDVVDDFLTIGDRSEARRIVEEFVMPYVGELNLPTERIFVRSQYAVVLARCGEHSEAEATLKRLRPYYVGLDEKLRSELMKNERLVHLAKSSTLNHAFKPTTVRAGRNDPCPCGSGLKFKKCHGL